MAGCARARTFHDVEVNHGGGDVGMTGKDLNGPDGGPGFSQFVRLQTALKITGEAGVMAVRVIHADELRNIVMACPGVVPFKGRSLVNGDGSLLKNANYRWRGLDHFAGMGRLRPLATLASSRAFSSRTVSGLAE